MFYIFRCPFCGHHLRVPLERIGANLSCLACNKEFRSSRRNCLGQAEPAVAEVRNTVHDGWLDRGKKAVQNKPGLLDGAISGALGGVFAGVLIGGIGGGVSHADQETMGGAFGGALSGVMSGFVLGFVVGTLAGALASEQGQLLFGALTSKPERTFRWSGGLIGGLVALIVVNFRWIPLGAFLGAVGSSVWPWLCAWEEGYLPPVEHTDLDMPPADQERDLVSLGKETTRDDPFSGRW